MAEPLTVKGIVAQVWDKEFTNREGTFTVVKLEGPDTAYFDFTGKVKKAGIKEGDRVEITYRTNGAPKIVKIEKAAQEKQTEIPVTTAPAITDKAPVQESQDSQAWRIARTSAMKIITEEISLGEIATGLRDSSLYKLADELAAYIVTGKHPETEKPRKGKK